MNRFRFYQACVLLFAGLLPVRGIAQARQKYSTDICIYGASAAGVIAAYTAKKMGKSVILIEPGTRIGGLTTGGLGQTDIGNKYAVTGLALDFYRKIGAHYGRLEQWTFEPKVAKQLFESYLTAAHISVLFRQRIIAVAKKGTVISNIVVKDAGAPGAGSYKTIAAKEFIDCTYEGDLMAKAKVSYTTGREANSQYNETYNGVQLMKGHQFADGVDPYKVPGDPASGLLWGISKEALLPNGSGDKKIQTYNIRICLTTDPQNSIPITKPKNYNAAHYELFLRWIQKYPAKSLNSFLSISKMPNNKTDINNNGAFSTDMIGMNWNYPEADYITRKKIQAAHNDYTQGFLYFVGYDPRVPEYLRAEMLRYGYPKDEYLESDHWTPQLYIREARRMIGAYVMTEANCTGKEVVNDGVGLAAYTMDSHNCERLVVNGMVKNEGNVEIGGFDPYPISYRSLIPKASECTNLLVPVCLSASHIAYGSIRMEPVFMVLGQSAAVAATMAVNKKLGIQEVPVAALQQELRTNPYADKRTADILVDNRDKEQVTITGHWQVMKRGGYGPDFLADTSGTASVQFTPEIKEDGIYEIYTYYPKLNESAAQTSFTVFDGKNRTEKIINKNDVDVLGQTTGEWVSLGTYRLTKGKQAFIAVSGKNAKGVVAADAILCIKRQRK
ncbi:MAG: FAD-dependent oxidoreductase [Niabella sp.]|nr:FAD-dependent oxidoreductase [Niabella sp.]